MRSFFAVCTLGAVASTISIQDMSMSSAPYDPTPLVPVTIQILPDGSFEVFSPICQAMIFTSNPLNDPMDTYRW